MTPCRDRLINYFADNRVPFQTLRHHQAFTAQEVAAEQKVPGKQVAKVVMVKANGNLAMLVLPAIYRINFAALTRVIGCPDVRLAKEPEFAQLFPDCDTGAMPPFGNLYQIPVYVDRSLAEDREIVFNAGTHYETMKVPYGDYARLAQPIITDFAVHL